MWACGRLAPDHKTIADFRRDYGRAIRQVCARFVALCRAMGLFTEASVAIDGGFVRSFAQPGGDVTGFTTVEASIGGKWLEMLHQVPPGVRRAVMMFDPDFAPARGDFWLPSFRVAAGALGIEPVVAGVRTVAEIDPAIADMGRHPEPAWWRP